MGREVGGVEGMSERLVFGVDHISQPRSTAAMRSRNSARYYGQGRDWATPPELFAELEAEFHFTLDPCCSAATAKCARYFTEAEDGLAQDWAGERVFMNPPYGREIYAWTRKARESAKVGTLVVGLLPASTDLAWWHDDILAVGAEVRFLRGRVRFHTPAGWANACQPSVVVVWRPA